MGGLWYDASGKFYIIRGGVVMKKFLLLIFTVVLFIGVMGCTNHLETTPDELDYYIQDEDTEDTYEALDMDDGEPEEDEPEPSVHGMNVAFITWDVFMWEMHNRPFEHAAREFERIAAYFGVDNILIFDSMYCTDMELALIEDSIAIGVDAIFVNPVDAYSTMGLGVALDAGLIVGTFFTDLPNEQHYRRDFFVGTSDLAEQSITNMVRQSLYNTRELFEGRPLPIQAQASGEPTSTSIQAWVSAIMGLRLREGPGTDFEIIRTIAYGTEIIVEDVRMGNSHGWFPVEYDGSHGYVSAVYVSLTRPATTPAQ